MPDRRPPYPTTPQPGSRADAVLSAIVQLLAAQTADEIMAARAKEATATEDTDE